MSETPRTDALVTIRVAIDESVDDANKVLTAFARHLECELTAANLALKEVREDAERLNWYERAQSEGHPHTPECLEGVWCYPYLVSGAGGSGGGVGHAYFGSLREAIDAARSLP